MFTRFLLFETCLSICVAIGYYEGNKIYDVTPENISQSDLLQKISQQDFDYDFFTLTKIPQRPARVMVPSTKQDSFLEFLNENGFKFEVVDSNVSKTIDEESRILRRRSVTNDGLGTDRYHSHEDINNYMENLAAKFPNRIYVQTVGKSYEKRLLKTIRITNGDGRSNKNVIFVDGGFHAREWISPATVVYLIGELSENKEEYAHLLKDFDWIILPVVNADGYEYTRSSPDRRLWRKTRSPSGSWLGRSCFGTDPNRNFDFHWNEEGASNNPCSEIFAGSQSFSDAETQVVRDILLSLKGRCKMYLTLHSYGNYLLYPWGWTEDLPDTWKDLNEVAQAGAQAIRDATGSVYYVGSSANTIYITAGSSDDFAFGVCEVPISLTMELPGGGSSGFDPAPTKIESFVTEAWMGIKAMSDVVVRKYPLN